MYPAGWFSDPQDPSMLRYYDGQNWTEHQHPVAPSAAAPAQPPQPTWGNPAQQAWQPEPTVVLPVVAAPPAQSTQPAWGDPGQQPWQPTGAPTWGPPPIAGGYPPQYPPQGRRQRNRPLILGVVLALIAGLLTGGYFLFFGGDDAPKITYQGAKIKDASGVLKLTEKNLETVIANRHGAKGADTRCYYAVPKTQPSGAKNTDVDPNLRCGPVLFVDGDAAKQYLKFALTRSGSGEPVTLSAATSPLTDEPVSAEDLKLQRPDGKSTPSAPGGLTVPAPPPAAADSILATELGSTATVPAAPQGAVIGSWSGGITVTNLGPVTRYGTGDDARSAPPGQKLIAFATTGAKGNDLTSSDLTSSATVSVDGGAARPVPATSSGKYVVVAVPTNARTVDLVLDDSGLKQSISLLDGKPGADNVLVLARQHRESRGTQTAKAVITYSQSVIFADGATGTSENATVTFRLAEIAYRNSSQAKTATASSPRDAIMHVAMTYVGSHVSGSFGFPSGLLTFTPTGGAPVRARNLAPSASGIYNIFDVPGNVTTGTLTLSGSVNQTFTSGRSYRFGVQTAISIRISIPAG